MKIITFFFLTLIVLSGGCFDGDRGVLTELLPAPAPPAAPAAPWWAEIPVGAGSELVVSPVPAAIENQIYGDWTEELDALERMLSIRDGGTFNAEGEFVNHELSTLGFKVFCDRQVEPREFYDKYIDAGGIAIIGPSDRTSVRGVEDEFLYAAREIILTMTSEMPALRRVLSPAHGFRYVLIGAGWEQDLNLPSELGLFSRYPGFYSGAGKGTLATGGIGFVVAHEAEELNPVVVTHEMAHAIDYALDEHPPLFPDFGARLTALYEAAYAKALQGKGYFDLTGYALNNEQEYWASGAEAWFNTLHGDDVIDGFRREEMLRKDPGLYALLDEVFPVVDFPIAFRIAAQ